MKKIGLFLTYAILLSSCTLTLEQLFLLPEPTQTPMPASTITSTAALTFTPITPTLTFTATPTLAGIKTNTPAPESTATLSSVTPLILITPNTPTPAMEMKGFLAVNISHKEFYNKSECQPSSVRITVQASDPLGTPMVALFVRFKTKTSGATSDWTRIMIPAKDYSGTFTHDLLPDEIKSVDFYHNSWVQFQFVAYTRDNKEIGRTGIFSERLTLLDCVPIPTPTLSPTPVILKP
ncbi:MAG: hypothetical protein HY864_14580 [Chloroflexi bacterium]|nr:hypothetical protein [Chloroflexota bacterium]